MKDGYHVNCAVSSNFLLDKGRVAENLQKECFCYFILYKNLTVPFSTNSEKVNVANSALITTCFILDLVQIRVIVLT